ncbi:hypothetical protein [Amycolatopsis sp. NPDC059021]|uniref:hypothetical protein n=1 Tax=Amycolatopsis sp. NPDC059021 TaxID=3346704 RepID=UPI00366A87B6
MAQQTKFDKDALDKIANEIRDILTGNGLTVFEDLKPHWPNAGKFAVAVWLEQIMDDRRNAIVAHANHLNKAFEQMAKHLHTVAKDFDNVDGENAKKIKAILDEAENFAKKEMKDFNTQAERDQGNRVGDDGKVGDGYSGNVNNPIKAGGDGKKA